MKHHNYDEPLVRNNTKISILDCCQQFTPFLSSELVSESYEDKLWKDLSQFPLPIETDLFAFECPLSGEERWADFHCRVQLPFSIENKEWKEIAYAFTETQVMRDYVKYISIELDIGSSKQSSLIPNIFFRINRNCERLSHFVADICRGSKQQFPIEQTRLLQKCVRPEFCEYYVGLMLARQASPIRLMTISEQRLCPSFYLEYLKNLNHEGIDESILVLLEKIFPFVHRLQLEIDLCKEVLPKIGFDCYMQTLNPDAQMFFWEPLLGSLVSERMIHPVKVDALYRWVGSNSYGDSNISHLKIVYQPGFPLFVKAYLRAKPITSEVDSSRIKGLNRK